MIFFIILLGLSPSIIWLIFFLKEDIHPEPKKMILKVFLAGAVISSIVLLFQIFAKDILDYFKFYENGLVSLFSLASIEEIFKFLAAYLVVRKSKFFDEPVDAMIYMITAALGFAALENTLFLFPFFKENIYLGLEVSANRFLGANLLHALSSGIVGYFLARAFFSPYRHHFVALGIITAALLHTIFNYLILVREALPQGTFYIIFLLSTMAVMVFVDFERLKKARIIDESPKTNISE